MMRSGGFESVRGEIEAELEEEEEVFFRVWGPDGQQLLVADPELWQGLGPPRDLLEESDLADEPIVENCEALPDDMRAPGR